MVRFLFLTLMLSVTALACTNEVGGGAPGEEPTAEQAESRLVVEYRFGNKLSESTVRIFESGVIVRTESACCPARIDPVLSAPMDAERVSALLADIERIEDAADDDDGNSVKPSATKGTGSLSVVKASGKRITLRSFGDKTRVNDSPRSSAIVAVVNALARQKMPL